MWNRLPLPTVEAVRFEVVGDALDPAAVTAALGLAPDRAARPGPCPPEVARALEPLLGALPDDLVLPGHWALSTRARVAPGWLEPHLRYLLARLRPRARALRALAADARLGLDVGFVISVPGGRLPPLDTVCEAASPWAQGALLGLGIYIRGLSLRSPPSGGDASPDEPWRGS